MNINKNTASHFPIFIISSLALDDFKTFFGAQPVRKKYQRWVPVKLVPNWYQTGRNFRPWFDHLDPSQITPEVSLGGLLVSLK